MTKKQRTAAQFLADKKITRGLLAQRGFRVEGESFPGSGAIYEHHTKPEESILIGRVTSSNCLDGQRVQVCYRDPMGETTLGRLRGASTFRKLLDEKKVPYEECPPRYHVIEDVVLALG